MLLRLEIKKSYNKKQTIPNMKISKTIKILMEIKKQPKLIRLP